MAKRARRLAATLSTQADRNRLLKYAVELDQEADELERLAAGGESDPLSTPHDASQVQQVQQQQQQQQESQSTGDASDPKPKS